jgi:uncharacterized protein involved in exopolysaccharide biosynthesis
MAGESIKTDQDCGSEPSATLIDFALIVAQNIKLIAVGAFGSGLLAMCISLSLPNIYTAKAAILPPNPNNAVSASTLVMGALGGALGGAAADFIGIKEPSQRFIAYLSSDTFLDLLILRLDLQNHYGEQSLYYARTALMKNLSVGADKRTGIITIAFSDKDKNFAAMAANAVVEELRLFVGRLDLQEAKNRQDFLESQIKAVSGRSFEDANSQQIVISGLIQQYNNSLIDAARTGPTFTQINFASAPEIKSKPKRALLTIAVTLVSALVLITFVFVRESFRNVEKNPETKLKINQIKLLLSVFRK